MIFATVPLNYCLYGCGVNNQHPLDLGTIFSFNLEKQVNDLVKKVNSARELTLPEDEHTGFAVFMEFHPQEEMGS
ncbi:hypothetical protein ACQUW5_13470 [Legionella sp. CNM-1927-20]|uniref:hypothetical protein n=1 Tax=Legionella sp. CNM-1927-20 TaxID=3422221 RepID=UPI00403ACFFE